MGGRLEEEEEEGDSILQVEFRSQKKSFNLLIHRILSSQGRLRVLPLGDLEGLEQHGARDGQDKHGDEQLPEQGRDPGG